MKKIYTMFMVMAMAVTVSAQGEWTKTIDALAESAPYYSSPVLTTADNGVAVAGRFDQTLVFGSSVVENVATSAYVAKYDSEGNELWMTAVTGAAIIKTMAEDANGNIIVAGTFAGDVTIGSFSLEGGYDFYYDKLQTQSNSFIATLAADGSVTAAKAFAPSANSSFWSFDGFMDYVFYFGEPSFVITSLSVDGNKVVAAGLLKGEINIGGEGLAGGTMLAYGMFLDDLATGVVFSTDVALESESVVAKVTPTESTNELQAQPWFLQATAADGKIYLASVITGKQTLTAAAQSQDFTLALAEGVDAEYGIVLAAIGEGTLSTQCYSKAGDIINPYELNAIATDGSSLYVAGTYKGVNPVNESLTAAGQNDIFFIKAATADLTAKAITVGYEEGDSNNTREIATALAIEDDGVVMFGYVADNSTIQGGLMLYSENGENSLYSIPVVVTGVCGQSTAMYNFGAEAGYTQIVSTEPIEYKLIGSNDDAIESVSASAVKANVIYDLQGRRMERAAKGLYIINGKKCLIK